MDYSPWGCKELDTIEQVTLLLHLQSINLSFMDKTGHGINGVTKQHK